MSENLKFALQTSLVMSIINCDFLRVTENFKPYFYVKPNIRKYRELFFLSQPMKQRSLKYQNFLQLLCKSFLCILFFKMIEINYVPIYMKINHMFFVIKGQFSVMDYIPNTIILYLIVHCIYVLCLLNCITCLR